MAVSLVSRVGVLCAALLFAVIAVGIWVAPQQAAQVFGLQLDSAAGRATLRADLGGVFASMAVLLGIGLRTQNHASLIAAAVLPTSIAAGRLIDWLASGGSELDIQALILELGVVAALWSMTCTRRTPRTDA